MAREKEDLSLHDTHYRRDFLTYDNQLLDGELFLQVRVTFFTDYLSLSLSLSLSPIISVSCSLDHTKINCNFQALNGFLMILDSNGELFFTEHSIETYLGFHQSDVIHQSVYELVHSEDREELQRQLTWSSFLSAEEQNASPPLTLHDLLLPENSHLLERSFTVRFRCLLDNTSGFLVRNEI